MTSVQLIISLHHLSLHQLDIKNVFLYGTLHDIYIEQLPSFVARDSYGRQAD